MRTSFMNKLILIAVLVLLCGAARAEAKRDVLAYCSGDWAWYAHVTKSTVENPMETPVSDEQTEFFVRHNGPGEQWRQLPTLSGRAIALASRMSQLAVLMNDGQWLTLWEDDSATGQQLPAGGTIKTIADDGTDLWAIGAVNGGITAAQQAIAAETASTMPTTAQALALPASRPENSTLPPRWVLFRQVNGRWATVAELPNELGLTPDEDLTLAVVGGIPLISFKTAAGDVRTLSCAAENPWQTLATVKPPATQPIANLCVFSDGFKPVLWITDGNSPGELFEDFQKASDGGAAVKLSWPGTLRLDGIPSVTFAGGYVCIFGPCGNKVIEQRYKMTGEPFETAAELTIPENDQGLVTSWVEAVVLAFMGFAIGAQVFRQWATGERAIDAETPVPAPLLPRLIAGLIDALPLIAAGLYVALRAEPARDLSDLPSEQTLIILGSALALYLLHTTLTELITGRSAGKWLLGLRVVTIDGATPTRAQFLIRNLLRVVDPLITIVLSPLRQRAADTAANTIVIRAGSKPVGPSADEMAGSDADKTDSH